MHENHSLCPRVTLLPNRPCFPINTKHFRRSGDLPICRVCDAGKKFERAPNRGSRFLSSLLHSGRSSRQEQRADRKTPATPGNLPLPDGGLFHFRSYFHRAARLAVSVYAKPYRSPACHTVVSSPSGDCSRSRNGKTVTSNSACHPVPLANREFLLRSDIPVAAFHPLSVESFALPFRSVNSPFCFTAAVRQCGV